MARFKTVTQDRVTWLERGRPDDPVGTAGPVSLFAGHVPNRVLIGYAAPSSGQFVPTWDEARAIINRPVYERRVFDGGIITSSGLNSMLAETDAAGVFPLVTFKEADWAGVAAGTYNSRLDIVRAKAISRRLSSGGNGKPFLFGLHHEPNGDGTPLSDWALMQIYCSNYFAGWVNDVYTAANDVTDIMCWFSIANGFKWGPRNPDEAFIAEVYPQLLVDTYRQNRSVLGNDFYDPVTGATTNPPIFTDSDDRTSEKVQAFVDWARASNSGALCCGEWSATTPEEHLAVWKVFRDNRDIFGVANCYNSIAGGSRWDWRLIPDSYPVTHGGALPDYPGGVEIGGTPQTEANLGAYRTIVDESILPQYTSPL